MDTYTQLHTRVEKRLDGPVPPILAETFDAATDFLVKRARKAVDAIGLAELKNDWLAYVPSICLVTTGNNGNHTRWLRVEWGLRIRVKAVSTRELEVIGKILDPIQIDEWVAQPVTTAWMNLDLCVSARVERE